MAHDTGKRVEKTPRPVKPPRSRPPAVIVTKDDEQFPELLKTIRRTVNPEATGNAIERIRNTQKRAAESVRKEVVRSLGPTAKVKKMENSATIEIRDLDGETNSEEVVGAVADLSGGTTARLVSLRKTFGGGARRRYWPFPRR